MPENILKPFFPVQLEDPSESSYSKGHSPPPPPWVKGVALTTPLALINVGKKNKALTMTVICGERGVAFLQQLLSFTVDICI